MDHSNLPGQVLLARLEDYAASIDRRTRYMTNEDEARDELLQRWKSERDDVRAELRARMSH